MTQSFQPATVPKAQTKLWDLWLDNVKMVLVTIVVIGYMIVLVLPGDEQSRTYDFIYFFYISAFVLVIGYFSKFFRYSKRHLWALLTILVVPYVVFSWLMIKWCYAFDQVFPDFEWLQNSRWLMWYLVATVIWRLLTSVLRLHWVMVPIAFAISLLGGLTNQELFDLNRVMGFLFFFVLGLHLRAEHLALLRRRFVWILGIVGMLFFWWLAARTDRYWAIQFLYFWASYAELGASDVEGMWIRVWLIGVALIGSAAVFFLVSYWCSFLTAMGAWIFVVYLCYGFVVRYFEYEGYEEWMSGISWWSVIITVAVGIALAMFLVWGPVARTLNYVVDPVNSIGRVICSRRNFDSSALPQRQTVRKSADESSGGPYLSRSRVFSRQAVARHRAARRTKEHVMGEFVRSELRQEVVSALIDIGAINLEAAGVVFSKFGERVIRGGDDFVFAIGKFNYWVCGWLVPVIRDLGFDVREG